MWANLKKLIKGKSKQNDSTTQAGGDQSSQNSTSGSGQTGSTSVLTNQKGTPQYQSMQEFHKDSLKPSRKGFPKFLLPLILVIGIVSAVAFYFIKFYKPQGNSLFGKKGEIVWWGIQLEENEINPLIEEYKKENPGVNIVYTKQSTQDYRERLSNSLALGRGPDIFEIHNSWPIMFKGELSTAPSSIMDTQEFSSTFYPIITKDLTNNNGVLAIPLEYDALTLFYNEDIFAAAAKTPPTTWDELKNVVKELTIKNKSGLLQSGIAFGVEDNIEHWQEVLALMMIQNKAKLSNPNSKDAKDTISFFSLIVKNTGWNKTYPPSTIHFARGRVAMIFAPSKRAREIIKESSEISFKTVPLPQIPKDSPDDLDFSYATYWVQGVWEKSANKDEAWKFLKYLSSKESLRFLNTQIKMSRGVETLPPRVDMALDYAKDPVLGSIVGLADSAKSWYLADLTYDGRTGVNSQINAIYKSIMKSGGDKRKKALENAASSIKSVFASFNTN